MYLKENKIKERKKKPMKGDWNFRKGLMDGLVGGSEDG